MAYISQITPLGSNESYDLKAAKLVTARTLTIGSTGKTFDGSGNVSWSHAEIGATVSNTWTAGTTAGPTIKTTVNGVAGTAVAIPSASASASGVVTTGAQTFAGIKTFTSPETINTTGNGAQVNFKFSDAATANGTYGQNWITYENTSGRFYWREWSGSSSGRTSYFEQYRLPACNASRTSSPTYEIITTKNPADLGYYLPLSGGQMTGPLTWKDGNALPEFSGNPPFLLGIESFANGGTTKWKTISSITVGGATKDGDGNTISSTYLKLSGGQMTGAIGFGAASMNRAILYYNSTYPKYGIWYNDASVDTMRFSASGNADTNAGADLCINGNGDGTVTIRGATILTTSNYSTTCDGRYVKKAGDTMSGTLHFKNITTGNYTEGIRLHPSSGGWNTITFCGTDNTGDSGTSTNTWGLFTHNGNFYIGKNGSDTAATFLRNVNGVWYWNGTAIGNASSANDISTGTPVLATATESNAITVIDLGNNVPATNQAQRHALDFKWYNSHWAIGNLRTGTSTSAGFGFSYSPDGTNWANKLIIGTNGSITIGHRETATSPSSATSSTRLTIIPYFHIGGPWTINSVDDSTNAYLTIKYGSSQITSLRHDGYMTAVRVYGAVWNDYAEYRKDNPNEIQEPGRCVRELGNGALALTTKRLERGCEIISDTFGFAIGQDEEKGYNTPIASNGRVLAYPYESIKEFANHIGWPVCSGPNGTVSIMTEEEEEKYPSRIIGTISEIPDYEEWGTGKVKVDGRVWIRIR